MNKNQKGFSVIEGLLILVALALIGGVGWYVWNRQNKDHGSDTSTSTKTTKADEKVSTPDDYLEITQWDVKMKLEADAAGTYYKMRTESGGKYTYAYIYNTNFDKLKGKNNQSCEDEPLFLMARYAEDDVRLEDSTNPKPDKYIDNYGYTGIEQHQAAPACSYDASAPSDGNPSSNSEFYDQDVMKAFKKYKSALTKSYKSLEGAK